jgi:hypothetical protein
MSTNFERKVTKAVKFTAIAEYFEHMPKDSCICEFTATVGGESKVIPLTAEMLASAMRKEIGLLSNKKPTPKQMAEQEVRKSRADMVCDFLRDHADEKFTVSELQRKVPGLPADINTSTVTALFKLPVLIQHSLRTVDKGRAYYQYID